MRDRDAATKQYMSHKDVVADAFNFYLYGGEQRILPERLRKMDATELASLYGKSVPILRAGLQTKSDCAGHDKGRRI